MTITMQSVVNAQPINPFLFSASKASASTVSASKSSASKAPASKSPPSKVSPPANATATAATTTTDTVDISVTAQAAALAAVTLRDETASPVQLALYAAHGDLVAQQLLAQQQAQAARSSAAP